VQSALNEGMLKFGDKTKPQMQVDVDPLKDVDAMYTVVVRCNIVETIVDAVEELYVEAKDDVAEFQMVDVSGNPKDADKVISKPQFDEKAKEAYPMDEEEFLVSSIVKG